MHPQWGKLRTRGPGFIRQRPGPARRPPKRIQLAAYFRSPSRVGFGKLGSLDPNRGATVKPRGASSTTMAGQGLYPTTNRGHLDSMVSGPTPPPPGREPSPPWRRHAPFSDIPTPPIDPDPRRGPLLVSPKSARADPC